MKNCSIKRGEKVHNLTEDQAVAVRAFAEKHGKKWKHQLSMAWIKAAAGPELQQVRNTLGPKWLAEVKIN